ncbi:MAG: hypothetical protein CL483_05705 [Acidobacteria bacterium]|nr:hypothetical protein [Acidobacteriota bacterium]
MAITLTTEAEAQTMASLKRYVREELDQDIGDLKAKLLLDYLLKEVGPVVYNQAISDAQAYFTNRVADLEGSCHEPEFVYWDD